MFFMSANSWVTFLKVLIIKDMRIEWDPHAEGMTSKINNFDI